LEIINKIIINASAEKTWNIVGQGFGNADKWLSMISSIKVKNDNTPLDGAPCSGRVCMTDIGKVDETITHYDETNKKLSFDIKVEKMPFFVKDLKNTWNVVSLEDNQTKVILDFKMEIMFPFNLLMGFMMKSKMGKIMKISLKDLKHYVETGKSRTDKAVV